MKSCSTLLLVLSLYKLIENTTKYIQNNLYVDKLGLNYTPKCQFIDADEYSVTFKNIEIWENSQQLEAISSHINLFHRQFINTVTSVHVSHAFSRFLEINQTSI